jgi:hypothetical protein
VTERGSTNLLTTKYSVLERAEILPTYIAIGTVFGERLKGTYSRVHYFLSFFGADVEGKRRVLEIGRGVFVDGQESHLLEVGKRWVEVDEMLMFGDVFWDAVVKVEDVAGDSCQERTMEG